VYQADQRLAVSAVAGSVGAGLADQDSERWIGDVTVDADTDPVKHMRLAALTRSTPLVGAELAATCRSSAEYPDRRTEAMLARLLDPDALVGWDSRHAAAARATSSSRGCWPHAPSWRCAPFSPSTARTRRTGG
jgi:hypothetical protein